MTAGVVRMRERDTLAPARDVGYVLITPARNEESNISKTIQAVLAQSILPRQWVIVSDGSIDATEAIVEKYVAAVPFIKLLRREGNREREFGSKVEAFRIGYQAIADVTHEFVGNLDADVSFPADYFEQLLHHFRQDKQLGICGGLIVELIEGKFVAQKMSLNSVAGAVQMFRRECYEDIGGYVGIKGGGIDAAAEITARMHGWKVRTFSDLPVWHHRRVVTGSSSIVGARFRQGASNYQLGYHPLFHLASCLSRMGERPYVLGSASMLCGYLWSILKRPQRVLPPEVQRYLQKEQISRLTDAIRSVISFRAA
jgi:biofilm PGA synthesis N-glycosyltransferase PgaC